MSMQFSSKHLTVFEIVFIAVVSVSIGFVFLGWNAVYAFTKPILKIYGLNYLVSGFWLLPSVFLSSIIRKPWVAIGASVIAASVEGLFAHWGIMALVWGLVQGMGAEFIFFIFKYRKWNLKVVMLASVLSCLFSYTLDYFYYKYNLIGREIIITQIISYIISSLIFAGILSNYLSLRLLKIGVLNNFLIAKGNRV